jgi:hypothetical protein
MRPDGKWKSSKRGRGWCARDASRVPIVVRWCGNQHLCQANVLCVLRPMRQKRRYWMHERSSKSSPNPSLKGRGILVDAGVSVLLDRAFGTNAKYPLATLSPSRFRHGLSTTYLFSCAASRRQAVDAPVRALSRCQQRSASAWLQGLSTMIASTTANISLADAGRSAGSLATQR